MPKKMDLSLTSATKILLVSMSASIAGCASNSKQDLDSCADMALGGIRPIASDSAQRFLGKVSKDTAYCRGGDHAVAFRGAPWVDWQNYYATGDVTSKAAESSGGHLGKNGRGVDGALLDLEYQRMELVKFNLFDNSGTYADYVQGRNGVAGQALKTWPQMQPALGDARFTAANFNGQICQGDLIRYRNLTGICNDIRNPLMGSTNMPFARNVSFETTFPDLGKNELARNRHGNRLSLLTPDPQVISRTLFTRAQSQPNQCQQGQGLPGDSPNAQCDYKQAPFFNVLAAFWIQFMTHDWFSHLEEGHNQEGQLVKMGCESQKVQGVEQTLQSSEIAQLGCRSDDRVDAGYVAQSGDPASFSHNGKSYLTRAYQTTQNKVTGWWDASQMYGYDETSRKRVKRDPADTAKLLLAPIGHRAGVGEKQGYLPLLQASDPMNPAWAGQEATAFPDNWTIGVSFYHNLFAREHNQFVQTFHQQAALTPDGDSGLRNPAQADRVISYRDVTNDELFEVARLVVAAEIAKIHTIEWTTQLLYDEPLHLAMNSNWDGLFKDQKLVAAALNQVVVNNFGKSENAKKATQWYSAFASGPGIVGLGNRVYKDDAIFAKYDPAKTDIWSLQNPDHVNGGVNHFGSPFNFPEEFVTVYRLHPLLPDLIEYREWNGDANKIQKKIPIVDTFRGKATEEMESDGLANWALSMGRQRLGALALQNHPQFLQNLPMPRLQTATNKIDVAALDIIRDRERGVPRFNEFRRQYGLQQLTSFDDFIDLHLASNAPQRMQQEHLVKLIRDVYGRHVCDATKVITVAQRNADGSKINDCLGHSNGSLIDNIEDLDTVVGWLAETTRPHGYAISETQFQVFILNASRRLFSDRFFTSSFRPEFYSTLGMQWVMNNGPDGKVMEKGKPNGHEMEVSPLKRVFLRAMPELAPELADVVNLFDPWARDRGDYYSLQWKARKGAEGDPVF